MKLNLQSFKTSRFQEICNLLFFSEKHCALGSKALYQPSKFPMLRAFWQFDKVTGLSSDEHDYGVYVGWKLIFHGRVCILQEQMDL